MNEKSKDALTSTIVGAVFPLPLAGGITASCAIGTEVAEKFGAAAGLTTATVLSAATVWGTIVGSSKAIEKTSQNPHLLALLAGALTTTSIGAGIAVIYDRNEADRTAPQHESAQTRISPNDATTYTSKSGLIIVPKGLSIS